jgi:hypothetical protein
MVVDDVEHEGPDRAHDTLTNRVLSFRTHRTGDIVQAAIAGFGPVLLGFAGEPEAKYFYGQAISEAGVIAATDWDAAG